MKQISSVELRTYYRDGTFDRKVAHVELGERFTTTVARVRRLARLFRATHGTFRKESRA